MDYPSSIKKTYHKNISYGRRGMDLEFLINEANQYYIDEDIALIYKKPTPIGITQTNYSNGTIKGFFKEQSTLDYNGIYKGYYIDFDAKVTNSKTSFPLTNIHKHQLDHIKGVIRHGGFSFLIIAINEEYYLLSGEKLLQFIKDNDRKSIPYDYFKEKGHIINVKYAPRLNYLEIIDKYGGIYEEN